MEDRIISKNSKLPSKIDAFDWLGLAPLFKGGGVRGGEPIMVWKKRFFGNQKRNRIFEVNS